MDVITPTLSQIRERTSEPGALQVPPLAPQKSTRSHYDENKRPTFPKDMFLGPKNLAMNEKCNHGYDKGQSVVRRPASQVGAVKITQEYTSWTVSQLPLPNCKLDKDQSSSIISGFAGLLTILLVIAVLCVLWNWNNQKKRRDPYLRVTNMPFLTLLRSGQRAKNIYDLLPWTQEELGRRHSSSTRIFSIESLFSRNSDSPCSGHVPSQAGNVLQVHRAQTHTVRIYDNATWPQMRGNLTPSAHYVNIRAPGDHPSISSEDSRDYVNVPTAEEIDETLASPENPPGNLFILPIAPELAFNEEGDKGCTNISDCSSFWSLGTENNDPLSDEEGSSQTSNDYVNMAELDLGAIQGKQPWVSFQYCRDYENVPPADPNGSQCQTEEVTTSNTNHKEDRTDGQGAHIQFVMQSRRFLDLGDYVIYQPSAQSEDSQVKHEEEMSDEDSNDYNTVLATKLGGGDSGQEPDTQIHDSFLIN